MDSRDLPEVAKPAIPAELAEQSQPPTNVTWDYEFSFPTTWVVRGKNPSMRVISKEQVEILASGGNPWPLALFTLTAGIAAGLFIQLKSGVVDQGSRNLLWAIFFPMTILALSFAISAIKEYFRTKRVKRDTVEELPSLEGATPITAAVRPVKTK